ncbi:unnamed protein product [Brachionus calyciflorus]|uniref:G-protein coupled receptors family 1 profile domain-containing protein n=1 Tax=Brachionus calyciflorus TaxID=104777 RepID=A0A814HR22_9BILA|nr:unnamed protein product [Brachionus calyciflorus]
MHDTTLPEIFVNLSNYKSTNSTANSNSEPIKIILIILKAILSLLCIFFNGFIIYLVCFKLKHRSYSNFLFLSGAISDFMIGLLSIPFMTVFTSYGFWPLGEGLCLFWVINDYSIGTVSIYSLLLMSIHRFRQLKWPLKVNENMSKEKYALIFGKWILIYLFWGLSVILVTRSNFNPENCYFTSTFAYVISADSVGYFLPVIAVFLTNIFVYLELRKNFKKRNIKLGAIKKTRVLKELQTQINSVSRNLEKFKGSKDNETTRSRRLDINKEKKAILCIWSISIFLCVLFSVFCISWPLKAKCSDCVSDVILEIGYWMSYIYSTFNPVILLIFNNKYRHEFYKTFCCCRLFRT